MSIIHVKDESGCVRYPCFTPPEARKDGEVLLFPLTQLGV